jgi:folate-dependent phosphoribosylglycinamide formyltransferase PurN
MIATHAFDAGMLAGYMLIFTGEMARRHAFLNLHPAEPNGPTGTWQEVVWQLIEARCERSGVMIHLATEELDRGPPVSYCTYSIRGQAFDALWEAIGHRTAAEVRSQEGEENALFREIRRHGVEREMPLVVETLRALASGRVRLEGGLVLDGARRELTGGLDLTGEIDAVVEPLSGRGN